MLSRPFLFRCPSGMSIPCVLLSMNEVAWQETRGMMNIGQEASEVGVGVAQLEQQLEQHQGSIQVETLLIPSLWLQYLVLPVSRCPLVDVLRMMLQLGVSSRGRLECSQVATPANTTGPQEIALIYLYRYMYMLPYMYICVYFALQIIWFSLKQFLWFVLNSHL